MSTVHRSWLIALIGLIFLLSYPGMGLAAPLLSEGLTADTAASSPTAILRVKNQTGVKVPELVLTGPKNYVFYNVPPAHTDYVVEKGRYRIEYTICGVKRSFMVDIKSDLYRIKISKCRVSKVAVINQTGGDIVITLSGPTNYRFKLGPGTNRILIVHGTYRYNLVAQCGSKSGRLEVKGRIRWTCTCFSP